MTFSLVLWTLLAGAADVAFGAERTPGCVSRPELAATKSKVDHWAPHDWTRAHVNQFFGAAPYRVQTGTTEGMWGHGKWRGQDYHACWNARTIVSVEFVQAPAMRDGRFRSVDVYAF